MNLKEFAALKAGDKIANDMSHSTGEVTEVTDQGAKVCWTPAAADRLPMTFTYVVNSTAWFHWRKVEELPESVA